MKLSFIIGFYPEIIGGAEYQAKIIAEELKTNFHYDIFFISYGHNKDKLCFIDNFKVYKLGINHQIKEKFNLYKNLCSRIDKIIEEEKPDIMYQRILNTISFRVSVISKKRNIPLIIHISDKYSISFNKTPLGFLKKLLFGKIIKNKPQLIVQTYDQYNLLKYLGIIPSLQIYNFHPAIANNKQADNSHLIKIFWIGSFRKVKRLELFLEVAQHFSSRTNMVFFIFGRTEKNRYGRTLLKKISLLNNVQYFGECPNDYINDLLSTQAYCLVNTSISEGFSNTFIQAWERGVPVISLNSNPDELLTKYQIGVFCNSSMSSMITNIDKLVSDKVLYKRMSENSIAIAHEFFTATKNIVIFDSYLKKVYRETK